MTVEEWKDVPMLTVLEHYKLSHPSGYKTDYRLVLQKVNDGTQHERLQFHGECGGWTYSAERIGSEFHTKTLKKIK